MNLHRNLVIPVMLVAGAAIALPYSAMPVQAKSTSASSSLVKRVFSASSLSPYPYAGASDLTTEGQSDTPLPEGKGRDLAQKKCSTCHATNIWASQHHTREQWASVIDTMIDRGLEASDEDLDTITDYLAQNFGPAAKPSPPAPPNAQPNPSSGDPATTKPPAQEE